MGSLETHGAKTAMPIVVQVGTANSARTDANEDVLRAQAPQLGRPPQFAGRVWRMNDKTALSPSYYLGVRGSIMTFLLTYLQLL